MIQHIEDVEVEVVALSPNSLMKKNRFICEVCNKGFQRDQNLQLHRRGHSLPWKLKSNKSKMENKKKVYLCPEPNCPHHFSCKALGDLTGIKKHFLRKHCEKKYKCSKCTKCYAVLSDWKAHIKNCGSNSYKCDCGLIFARKDTFRTHKAFCEALAAETERISASHPHLDTSSEDSANEAMNLYQQDNNNILFPPPLGFTPMHHNQLNMMPPPPGGFHPINHPHHLLTTYGPPLGHVGIKPNTIQSLIKDEPITSNIHGFPFLTNGVTGDSEGTNAGLNTVSALQNYYRMSALQNYHQQSTSSAIPLLQRDMMGSTMSNQLQMGGETCHGGAMPFDYYYLMSKQNHNEQPTRDFLSLAVGHGGEHVVGSSAMSSTIMDGYKVSPGGATDVNLIGHGIWGRNDYAEGSEWFPRMTNFENDNAHQMS